MTRLNARPMRSSLAPLLVLLACALALGASWRPASARAFCGFYVAGSGAQLENQGTHVVLMREGTQTVLSMQNDYQGPPENFAMVVPVPVVLQEEDVRTLQRSVFERVNQLAAPRLVEYWEQDPCAPPAMPRPSGPRRSATGRARAVAYDDAPGGVVVEAQFAVGEYEIVILSASDSGGLDRWLRSHGYQIPAGAAEVLRPYVQQGMKFFVAKVDVSRVTFEEGRAVLSPLRVQYESATFSLPVRLGLLNSTGEQDLLVHILAPNQRYEVANYRNVTIPTNLNVTDRTRDEFGRFYNALFRETLQQARGAVVTEYAWQASSCDPCPGGMSGLSQSDLQTLGADVSAGRAPSPPPPPPSPPRRVRPAPSPLGDPAPQRRRPSRPRIRPNATPYVLTRLHYRYAPTGLGEDLVFRAAAPIEGGRESTEGQGAVPASLNNFQARYAIRHAWSGPVACENPRRGIWGGPPRAADRSRRTPVTPPGLDGRRERPVNGRPAPASAQYRGEGSPWSAALDAAGSVNAQLAAANTPTPQPHVVPTQPTQPVSGGSGSLASPDVPTAAPLGCSVRGASSPRERPSAPFLLLLPLLGLFLARPRRRSTH